MSEGKLEKRVLYVIVFILIGIVFTLFFWMFADSKVTGLSISNMLGISQYIISFVGMIATAGAATAALVSANLAKKNLENQSENDKRALMPFIVIEEKSFNIEYNSAINKKFDLNGKHLYTN